MIAIDTDNQAFLGIVALRSDPCYTRFISSRMAFGAKQLDIFRLLASQGNDSARGVALGKHSLAHNARTDCRAAQ